MVYEIECPVCNDKQTYNIRPVGLSKCKSCNSLFAPRAIDQSKKKKEKESTLIANESTNKPEFNFQLSDSEDELDPIVDGLSLKESNSKVNQSKDKMSISPVPLNRRFVLEFSDDSDNEINTPTNSITEKKQDEPMAIDSDNEVPMQQRTNNKLQTITNASSSKPKKRAFQPMSSDSEEEDFLPVLRKRSTIKKKSIVDYGNDPLFAEDLEIANNDNANGNSEDENYQPLDTLFSDDDSFEEEFVPKKLVKKRKGEPKKKEVGIFDIINNDNDINMDSEDLRDADSLEVYTKGGKTVKNDKKERKLPVKRSNRGSYRFAPKPGNRFNPYILFNKEYRRKLKDANPNISNADLNILVGKTYRELDPVEKEKLIANARKLADQEKAQYSKPERPKIPPNAYILFKMMNKDKCKDESDIKNVNQHLADLWKKLPDDEKELYKEEALSRKQEFIDKNPLLYKQIYERARVKGLGTRRLNRKHNSGDSSD